MMITNNSTHLNDDAILNVALNVLTIEAQALMDLTRTLDINFVNAVRTMLACKGRVVVSGMGKSGHIARKLAATFASTGTPSFFMHPGEAAHGDLGMITADDVVLALSYSGKSDELMAILPAVKRHNTKLIAMTGNPESPMAKLSDVHLLVQVEKEACPLNLAPTASTTASLALGDALAVALLELRGFSADDFARSHPAGAGRHRWPARTRPRCRWVCRASAGSEQSPGLARCWPQLRSWRAREHLEQEAVLQRHILEGLVAAAHATVAGVQVGFQQQQVVVGLARA